MTSKIIYSEIMDRIKTLKKLRSDNSVARVLGLSRSAFSERKKRESIPYEELARFSEQENVSLDWLLTGEEPIVKGRVLETIYNKGIKMLKEPLTVGEKPAIYNNVRDDSELGEILQLLKEHPQDKKLVLKLLKGKKDIKEALEGFEVKNLLNEEG